jgi:glycosyltransferase involved in cell wall biosynthesis
MSFSIIAREHIKYLSQKIKITEIDEEALDNLYWLMKRDILLHPILYVTIGDKVGLFDERQKRLRSILKVKGKLGGFETTDSDRISKIAIDTLSKVDLMFVPSKFAFEVYRNSGANLPIEVLPHGLSEAMTSDSRDVTNPDLKKILNLKTSQNAILVLFFMLHSDYRKGADLVYEAMNFLQRKNDKLFLILKKTKGDTDWSRRLKRLRTVEVSSWLPDADLRQLYDLSDILLVPSRGGGFEINALEGLARGLPTIVPNAGCFKDYIQYCIPTEICKQPQIFPDNPIHVGKGWEVDGDSLAHNIDSVANDLETWREKALSNSQKIREAYSWKVIGKRLYQLLCKYNFCEEKS